MFMYQFNVVGFWWIKGGVLWYRYVNSIVEKGDIIYIDMNLKGDSVQILFEYGVF